jgi:hypothetical protein
MTIAVEGGSTSNESTLGGMTLFVGGFPANAVDADAIEAMAAPA